VKITFNFQHFNTPYTVFADVWGDGHSIAETVNEGITWENLYS